MNFGGLQTRKLSMSILFGRRVLVRVLELLVLIVIDCSKITGADSNKKSKNYGCQSAYFSKLRLPGTREPMANKGPDNIPFFNQHQK